jgi:hypothetical protein
MASRNMTDHPLVPLLDETVYLVLNDFGELGCAWVETDAAAADLETTICNLLIGQYSAPARVIAFNTSEGWSKDVSEDVAREVWHRTAGQERHDALRRFIDRHLSFPKVIA